MTKIKLNKYKYHLLLIIVLSLSYFNLQKEAADHFQETDSVISYDLLENYDNQIISYALWSYKSRDWSNYNDNKNWKNINYYINHTPDFILNYLITTDFFIKNFEKISNNKSDFPNNADEARKVIVDSFIRSGIEDMPIHGLYRIGQSVLIDQLPGGIAPVITYPLSSTYTFGMGIYYQIIKNLSEDYGTFVENAVKMNLLLLHLALFFAFLTLIGIGIKPFIASISVLTLTYTASFYSYGFHMGSTAHAFIAYAACFYSFTKYNINDKNSLFKLGLINSVLLFYSYLLIIPLLAVYLYTFVNFYLHSQKLFFKSIFLSLFLHKIALFLNLLCILIFYQPGQGIRGEARSWSEIFDYIYFSILNLTGWVDTGIEMVNLIQFILFGSIALFGCINFFKENNSNQGLLGLPLIKYSFAIYIAFLIIGLLNFAPTRHILFLQIFLVIFYSYALSKILRNHDKSFVLNVSLIAIIFSLGTFTQNYRMNQTKSINYDFKLLKENAFIVSDTLNTISKKTDLKVIGLNEEIEDSKNYYFISQTTSFNELDQRHLDRMIQADTNVVTILEAEDRYSFMPFNLTKYKDGRFAFNRGNGMYIYEIKN